VDSREEELRKALEQEEESEEKASRWDFRNKANWRFSLGKTRKAKLGFWLLAIGFVLFLITQLIFRPGVGG